MTISSHASRWLVAAVAAPILIWVIFFAPPAALLIVVAIAGGLAWWEFYQAAFIRKSAVLAAIALIGWLAAASGAHFYGANGMLAGLFFAVSSGCIYFLLTYKESPSTVDSIARFVFGHGYISLFFALILCLFSLDKGPWWILYLLLVTMLGDTAAYYSGRFFGKTPLYPSVSPKKTWEGLVGAVLTTTLVSIIFALFILPVRWNEAAPLGFFLGFWGAAGDLFESMIKRSAGVKDSGKLLMGHGGLWDRIDAILFNTPVIFFFALTRSI